MQTDPHALKPTGTADSNRPPDYVMIGAMKCATSTVSAYLEDHPGTFMLANADPNFFSDDAVWQKGTGWYQGLFADAEPGQIRGESSNSYTNAARFPDAPERLHAVCPEARLIYIVRDPIARLTSHWIQSRADLGDLVAPTLDRAVLDQPERFVDQSRYWHQLSRYRALYPDARIFIGFMEELQSDPETFFTTLCQFLDIAPWTQVKRAHQNKSTGKRLPTESYTNVRKIPGVKDASRLMPRGLKNMIRRNFFSQKVTERPAFSPEMLIRLKSELAEDTAAFLAHAGRPADFWEPRNP